jgi:triphosphatase
MAAGQLERVADGFVYAVRRPLARLGAALQGVGGPDGVEAVHDARVCLRRIGAALAVFDDALPPSRTDRLREELRWLRRNLGPLRDVDVFLADIVAPLARRVGADPGLEALAEAAARRRATLVGATAAAATGLRAAAFAADLGQLVADLDARGTGGGGGGRRRKLRQKPLRPFALKLLRKRFKKLARAAEDVGALDDDALHRLRIRVRALRYTLDFFAPLLPPRRLKELRLAMTRLQDTMGRLNDLGQAVSLTATLTEGADPAAHDLARGAGAVLGWCAARRVILRDRLPALFPPFLERGKRMMQAARD